ncbi:MAG: hypothetical protein V1845_04155, partial [bacterium]
CPPDDIIDTLSAAMDEVILVRIMKKFDLPLNNAWPRNSVTARQAAQNIARAFSSYALMWDYAVSNRPRVKKEMAYFAERAENHADIQAIMERRGDEKQKPAD